MNLLKVTHASITEEALLRKAESIPGAWNGIRIAALLLLLKGWKSTAISQLFGVSRQAVVDWIRKANKRGLDSVLDELRPGRPTRLSPAVKKKLVDALTKSPEEFGLRRTRWDGVVVVEFLHKICNVELKPRQARNWLKRLGFALKLLGYAGRRHHQEQQYHNKEDCPFQHVLSPLSNLALSVTLRESFSRQVPGARITLSHPRKRQGPHAGQS